MYKVTNFKWVPKPDATDTVFNALQPAIRFTKEECLDLPDIIYTTRDVPLTRQQEKYYKELKDRMVMEAAEETVTAATAAVNMNKLLQISSGAVYTDDKEVVEFDIKHRYKVLREVIDESSKKGSDLRAVQAHNTATFRQATQRTRYPPSHQRGSKSD